MEGASTGDRSSRVPYGEADQLPEGGVLSAHYRGLTIGVVTLVVMVAFEAMAVTTAMPAAVRELDGLAFYAWGFSGFMVAMLFGTVVSGELCDRIGPTKPFVAGVALFVIGLVVAGLASAMLVFVLGRVVQGLGAGVLTITIHVIAGRAFPSALRPSLYSMISAGWVLPALIGPLISGTLTEHLSWRWVFLGLLPLAIAPILLVVRRLRALPPIEAAERRPGRALLALSVAIGIGLLQYAGQEPSWWTLGLAVVGLVLLVPNIPKLMPPGALRLQRGMPTVVVMRGLAASAFFGTNAFLPLMLTEHRGLTTTMAGIVLTVGSLGWSGASWIQGRRSMRLGRAQLIQLGTVLLAIGLTVVLISVLTVVPVWVAGFGAVVAGLGMGATMPSLSVLLLEYSPTEEQGKNSASAQMADAIGQVTLIGLGGVLFAGLHTTLPGTTMFVLIEVLMVAAGVTAALLAHRVRLAHRL